MPTAMDDAQVLARQVGRRLRGAVTVARRCAAGHPCVVTTYPLLRERGRLTPFPTLHWLTCPALCRWLATLERDGALAVIEAELQASADTLRAVRADHEQCVAERWALLTPADRVAAELAGFKDLFHRRGIAGTADWSTIKCLHAHYAHHLVHGGVVGRIIDTRFDPPACRRTPEHR